MNIYLRCVYIHISANYGMCIYIYMYVHIRIGACSFVILHMPGSRFFLGLDCGMEDCLGL